VNGLIRRDGRTDEYFDGAAAERLMLRRCGACGHWHAPDASYCVVCGGEDLGWARASGDASLVSWAIVHSRDSSTAPVALIELAEGPWIYGRAESARPYAGQPLRAFFIHPDNGESYPIFKERS
jgi:uncharacterized protein